MEFFFITLGPVGVWGYLIRMQGSHRLEKYLNIQDCLKDFENKNLS